MVEIQCAQSLNYPFWMLEILPQIIWFALLSSAIYALLAVGASLIFGILEFINFAQGDFGMIGAYLFFTLFIILKLPIWLCFMLVVLGAALFGVILERLTFKRVRKCHDFIPLVISIGVSGFLQSVIILFFGGAVKTYRQGNEAANKIYELLDGRLIITETQITLIATATLLLIGLYFFLSRTKTGKAIRAVADNKEVASILGISIDKTVAIIFALGTALAAVAGFLVAGEENLNPTMGVAMGVTAFLVIILGGVGNLKGAVAAALIIGFAENLMVGLTPIQPSFKDALIFVMAMTILFFKPNGIFGPKLEEEARK